MAQQQTMAAQSQLQKWAGKAEVEFQYSQEMHPGELGLGLQDAKPASSEQN